MLIVSASVALHIDATLARAIQPRQWPWVLAQLADNHLVLSALVRVPRGCILGPNIVCLSAAAGLAA